MMNFNPKQAFDLPALPPPLSDKELFQPEIAKLTVEANKAVSELNGLCHAIPNAFLLMLGVKLKRGANALSNKSLKKLLA